MGNCVNGDDFLSAPAIAASLTPTLEENSAFSYSEGSENDYNFTLQEADAEGNLTTKYYKIDLKPEAFSTSKNISWTAVGEDQKDATDVVAVQLPNNQSGAIHNSNYNAKISNISSDFINNHVYGTSASGGAIYNFYGTINGITGHFIPEIM